MTTIGGADGCPGGWICVERDTVTGEIFAEVLPTTAALRDRARHLAVLTVDIPIGLSETGPRDCDVEARRLLTSLRGSSVFPAPVRPAIDASSYTEACERSEAACGKRLSKQAHAIMWRIREVDEMLRGEPELQGRVREIHPEVCFYAWADDDILDAFAALWTAERILRGEASTVPEAPREDRYGLRMEMVT